MEVGQGQNLARSAKGGGGNLLKKIYAALCPRRTPHKLFLTKFGMLITKWKPKICNKYRFFCYSLLVSYARLGDRGITVQFSARTKNLSLLHSSGAHPISSSKSTRGCVARCKAAGAKIHHPLPSTAEVKNAWSYISTSVSAFLARCLTQGQLYIRNNMNVYSTSFLPSFLSALQLGVSFGLLNNLPQFFSPSEADCLVSEQFSFYGVRL
jgi:hypothetical protein